MKVIELERWKPSETDPSSLEYKGQPTADEVFAELKHRLEGMGYLPDEYFELRSKWENGREVPKGADVFCTVDYGESEGVYVDVCLKWFDTVQEKFITSGFIAGKTLGETGNDLDRMFLTASAITKAFHGDNATHSRYMKIGFTEEDTGGCVVHLSQQEQKVLIDALVEQRERQEQAMTQTEQLLRRMTGSITEYVNTIGMRPLRMSDYDQAVLAIRDGNLEAFKIYAAKAPDPEDSLLVEAAGRPGAVGRKMTELLVADRMDINCQSYHAACQKAIDIEDAEKTFFLLEQAQSCVSQLKPSFYGEMASHAYLDHRALSREIIRRGANEQIAAAPPYLLEQFASGPDERMMSMLVEKGISGGNCAARTLHMLTYEGRHSWLAELLLEKRMWVDPHDLIALHRCIENGAAEVCKRLLDGGMDFERYCQWNPATIHPEIVQDLKDYWTEMHREMEQAGAPAEAQRSGFGGERSRSGMSELLPEAEASDMELAATMGGQALG